MPTRATPGTLPSYIPRGVLFPALPQQLGVQKPQQVERPQDRATSHRGQKVFVSPSTQQWVVRCSTRSRGSRTR